MPTVTPEQLKAGSELLKLVIPLIAKAFSPLKKGYAGTEAILRLNYERYLSSSIAAHEKICTILDPSLELSLESVYVPLSVRTLAGDHTVEVKSFPSKLFADSPQNLIIDSAGMGKSTLSRFILLQCARADRPKYLPIFIELRRMKSGETLLEFISKEIALFKNSEFSEEVLLFLLGTNQFLLMLDGVDELAEGNRRAFVDGLRKILTKCSKCPMWITSRNDPILTEFPSLVRWSVLPLTRTRAYQLIRQYEKNEQLASQLIATLKVSAPDTVGTFLGTPLLVVLLVGSYENKPLVPVKRSNFYHQVFDALFERHDAIKGGFVRNRKSNLSVDQFHQILRALGFCLIRDGTVEFDFNTYCQRIAKVKQLVPHILFEDSELLSDLLHAVPLLVQEGGKYRFVHKSMIDFFAASYICTDLDGQEAALLNKLYEQKQVTRFSEVLRFCADIDFATFRQTILQLLAKDVVAYGATNTAYCPHLSFESAQELKKATFFAHFTLIKNFADSKVIEKGNGSHVELMMPLNTSALDSMRVDYIGSSKMLYTVFRNAYSFFKLVFNEHPIPFMRRVSRETVIPENAFEYLMDEITTPMEQVKIGLLGLDSEQVGLIENHNEIGLLASRCNLQVDFTAANQFVEQLSVESAAGKSIIGDVIESMLQQASRNTKKK
ncbi:NACHT domain-containing protein [Polaromonas sp. YR568]|uniref:NACHT domain-containing protein n=1 Tax=Polaromonas sp. YR568 TaxID=1855301 RepID=UPI003137E499